MITPISSTGTDDAVQPWNIYGRAQKNMFLFVLFLVGTSNVVDRNIIGVLLEEIKTEFGASDTMLGLLSGLSFAAFYATLGIPIARWADRGNRKTIITMSLTVWSVMTVVSGMAGSFWQLAAARFGVGAGEAGAMPASQSLLADYYSPAERAKAIGIFMMSNSAGYAIGLIAGGYLALHFGWRVSYVIVGLLGVLLVPLTHFLLSEPRKRYPPPPKQLASGSTKTAILELLRKKSYRALLGGIVLYFLMSYGALVFTVSLMMRVHGIDVAQAGAIFGGASAAGAVVGGVGGGFLAARLAARDLTWLARIAGLGILATFPVWELALWSQSLGTMIGFIVAGMILIHAGLTPAFSAIHVVCGSQRRALSVALVYFFANLIGLGLGPVITGAISDALQPGHPPGEGLRLALMAMTVLLVPAGLLFLRAAGCLLQDAED